jgi:hypothetical protein
LAETGVLRSISVLSVPAERFLTEQDIKMLQLPKLDFVRDTSPIVEGSIVEEPASNEPTRESASDAAPDNVAVLKPR